MIGIDEVGRGSWAGPLLVCAVRLHKPVLGLTDSKLLSAPKRQALSKIIIKNADIGYGWVSASYIDDIGLSQALVLATSRALQDINPSQNEQVIIDGNVNFAPNLNSKCIPKADINFPVVSAASIVAKVKRDELMQNLSKKYTKYGFGAHVGYGTKQHKQAIAKHGLTDEHRLSYKINL